MTKDKLQILIGQRVIALRNKKGWSQAELSRQADKSPQAIEKLENGKVNPTLYSLHEVAIALGVKLSALVDFEWTNSTFTRDIQTHCTVCMEWRFLKFYNWEDDLPTTRKIQKPIPIAIGTKLQKPKVQKVNSDSHRKKKSSNNDNVNLQPILVLS